MINRFIFVCSLLVFVIGTAQAGLVSSIDRILTRDRTTRFSIHIIDGDSKETVYDHGAHRAFIPASNMKVVTSSVALQYLGKNYEFVTRVGMVGDALVIIGGGDPLLGDPEADPCEPFSPTRIFDEIASRLQTLEIKHISNIIVDTTFFDDQRVHPHWDPVDLNRAYAAEVSGLNYFANKIDVRVENVKNRVSVLFEPSTSFLGIRNKVTPRSRGGRGVSALRLPGQPNVIELRGEVSVPQGFELAIERPGTYFGFMLAEALRANGITVQGELQEAELDRESAFLPVVEFRTPLQSVIKRCNKDSFNLAAEALLKTVAAYATQGGRQGSWSVGQNVFRGFLEHLGVPSNEFTIDDGSGLSDKNRLSAHALTSTFYAMYQSDYWDFYYDTLAISGVDGTLRKYSDFKVSPYQGAIRGKTGYITGAKSFSGVCFVNERVYFFSILANKTTGKTRKVINDIARAIVDHG